MFVVGDDDDDDNDNDDFCNCWLKGPLASFHIFYCPRWPKSGQLFVSLHVPDAKAQSQSQKWHHHQ